MKNSAVIILVWVLLSYQVVPAIIFVDFKINQDFIAEFLCVNKDVPESSCNGQCHLKKEIDKATKSEGDEEPKSFQFRKLVQIVCPIADLVKPSTSAEFISNLVFNQTIPLSTFADGVFHPPRNYSFS